MSDMVAWLIVAGIVIVLELFSGTFYLLMIAFGLFSGALAAYFGLGFEAQFVVAAVVGAFSTVALRRSRFGARNKISANRDPNVNLDIGQPIQIAEWKSSTAGIFTARAMHRGALWDVELHDIKEAVPGRYKIVEIRGSLLIVELITD